MENSALRKEIQELQKMLMRANLNHQKQQEYRESLPFQKQQDPPYQQSDQMKRGRDHINLISKLNQDAHSQCYYDDEERVSLDKLSYDSIKTTVKPAEDNGRFTQGGGKFLNADSRNDGPALGVQASESLSDMLHQQYLRERPLLEQIRKLRIENEELERKWRQSEFLNLQLIDKVKHYESKDSLNMLEQSVQSCNSGITNSKQGSRRHQDDMHSRLSALEDNFSKILQIKLYDNNNSMYIQNQKQQVMEYEQDSAAKGYAGRASEQKTIKKITPIRNLSTRGICHNDKENRLRSKSPGMSYREGQRFQSKKNDDISTARRRLRECCLEKQRAESQTSYRHQSRSVIVPEKPQKGKKRKSSKLGNRRHSMNSNGSYTIERYKHNQSVNQTYDIRDIEEYQPNQSLVYSPHGVPETPKPQIINSNSSLQYYM